MIQRKIALNKKNVLAVSGPSGPELISDGDKDEEGGGGREGVSRRIKWR